MHRVPETLKLQAARVEADVHLALHARCKQAELTQLLAEEAQLLQLVDVQAGQAGEGAEGLPGTGTDAAALQRGSWLDLLDLELDLVVGVASPLINPDLTQISHNMLKPLSAWSPHCTCCGYNKLVSSGARQMGGPPCCPQKQKAGPLSFFLLSLRELG